jgi:DNA-directed RNA polymerase specialized sigma24 family protein
MSQNSEGWLPTRRSMIERLKNWDDHDSWREFFDSYWRPIYGVALRYGLTDSEAEEVVQETVLSIAKKMDTFKYDPAVCSFKSWFPLCTISSTICTWSKSCRRGRWPRCWPWPPPRFTWSNIAWQGW